MTLEVCCGNVESVHAAVRGGAPRIEFCSHLELDGLTPRWEDLRAIRAQYPQLSIQVLIRPRAGDFRYTASEVEKMAADIETALDLGADGVVIGALDAKGDLATGALLELTCTVANWAVAKALQGDLCHASNDAHFFPEPTKDPEITFHRAFDVCRNPREALEELIGLDFDRILTSGQASNALEGAPLIRELRDRAAGRIHFLPGGGVTPENARAIVELTGCTQLHASASVSGPDGRKVTDEGRVSAILSALKRTKNQD